MKEGYEIGYRRPPKRTRWAKGQSGNSFGRPPKAPKKIWQKIQDELSAEVNITEGEVTRKATVFEAILLHLWRQMGSGDSRALRVFYKYEKFAKSKARRKVVPKISLEQAKAAYELAFERVVWRKDAPIKPWMTAKQAMAIYEESLKETEVVR